MAWRGVQRLVGPAVTLALLLIPGWPLLEAYGGEARELSQRVIYWALGTAIGFSLAWLLVRLIDVAIWGVVERRFARPVPRLLKDIVVAAIFLVTVITILGLVFRRDVTGLWVSSGVLGIIIGFAVRGTIADVFCGIALNVDHPFRPGDWIEVHSRGIRPMRGCVEETNWRSTRLKTVDNTIVVIPNSLMSAVVLVNLSLPEPRSRFEQVFCIEFGVPPERVLRVLLAGAKAVKEILEDPPPKAYVDRTTEVGVEYKVRYWLEPRETSPHKGRHLVTASILQHLYHAGISLAYPKQDLYWARMPTRQLSRRRDRQELLSRVGLLAALQPGELELLAEAVSERKFNAGEAVVRQHEPGASMFVVVEGLLDVCKDCQSEPNGSEPAVGEGQGSQHTVKVVELQPGDFFGEMSFLTGAPRSATVIAAAASIVYEIGATALQEVLERRPEVAEQLAVIAARRHAELEAVVEQPAPSADEVEKTLMEQILAGMRSFFGNLSGRSPSS
ncbi:MAG: mechanosensitive ion channel family protein [Verrucomicrobiales bacterium]|nr:mechanosensitive ion channel family protein [Verrucomicrobiales bacterium]